MSSEILDGEQLIDLLDRLERLDVNRVTTFYDQLRLFPRMRAEQSREVIRLLDERWVLVDSDDHFREILTRVVDGLAKTTVTTSASEPDKLFDDATIAIVEGLLERMDVSDLSYSKLLRMLARDQHGAALELFARTMVERPPTDERGIDLAFGPLFQRDPKRAVAVFPKLFEGFGNPIVAAASLDLANFLAREKHVETHPAQFFKDRLALLLGALVGQLAQLEKNKFAGHRPEEVKTIVNSSIALGVALCDAIALLNYREGVGKLFQALDVSHRRLRAEAAAALTKFGEERGKSELLMLAAEPVTRLRVLKYAEELGILDEIEAEYKTEVARAEAELATWLARPENMGLPPSECELLTQRTLYWPGIEEPVECFLFRYIYDLAGRAFSNIGLVGPMTHAFASSLEGLHLDDVVACFAGWDAEHEEIGDLPIHLLNEGYLPEIARLERKMKDFGLEAIVPETFGNFFGEKVLVAKAMNRGEKVLAVGDSTDVRWFPVPSDAQPLTPQEVYSIYKGQKLLRAFNEGFGGAE